MSEADRHQSLAEALRGVQRTLPGASSFLYCCNLVTELSSPPGPGATVPLSLTDRIQAEYLLLRLLAGVAPASPDAPEGIPPFAPALLSLFEQRGAAADAAELHVRVERLWLATLLCSPDDVIEAVWSPRSAQEVATTLAPRASAGDVDEGTLARLAALRSSWDLRLPSRELLMAPLGAFGRHGRATFGGVPAGAEAEDTRVAPLPPADVESLPLCGGDVLGGIPVAAIRRLSAKLVASGELATAPESWLPLLPVAPVASSHADAAPMGARSALSRHVSACAAADLCAPPDDTAEVATWPTELLPRVAMPSPPRALLSAGTGGSEESAGTLRACVLLDRAIGAVLSTEAAAELVALLRAAPKRVLRSNVSPLVLAGLVEHNHSIATLCVRCLAAIAPPALVARYWCVLVQLDVTLHSMEAVAELAGPAAEPGGGRVTPAAPPPSGTARGMSSLVVPTATPKLVEAAASLPPPSRESAPAVHPVLPLEFVAYFISRCISACDNAGSIYAQNRLARLVGVFLASLLRNGILGPDSLSLAEISSFGTRYSRISECAQLYKMAVKMAEGAEGGSAEHLPHADLQSQR